MLLSAMGKRSLRADRLRSEARHTVTAPAFQAVRGEEVTEAIPMHSDARSG
ncbi:hypothetical protein SAMN05446635_4845 [Burkholderia sp. OK233]|nr:hypothetical protein SAMN05446635_4845 [Burkholderia sp. OK233]